MPSSYNSNLAKRILQVSILNVAGALGQATVEPNTDVMSDFAGCGFWTVNFLCILLCILVVVLFMMAGDPALQSDGHNRDRQLFLSYRFFADAFARLRNLMSRDHQQIGRGFAILHPLTEILEAFETNTDVEEHQSFLGTMRYQW